MFRCKKELYEIPKQTSEVKPAPVHGSVDGIGWGVVGGGEDRYRVLQLLRDKNCHKLRERFFSVPIHYKLP